MNEIGHWHVVGGKGVQKNEGMAVGVEDGEGTDTSQNILLCAVLIPRTILCLSNAKFIKDKYSEIVLGMRLKIQDT